MRCIELTVMDMCTVHILYNYMYIQTFGNSGINVCCLTVWLANKMKQRKMVMKESHEFPDPVDIFHLPCLSTKKQGHQ